MSEDKKNEMPDISVAILFGFLAVLFPLMPIYLGWSGKAVSIGSFVLAAISLAIAVGGAAIELRRLGFFEGTSWENVGYALFIAIIAGVFHYLAVVIPIDWVTVVLKLVAIVVGLVALMFLSVALGQFLVDQREKRAAGSETRSSRTKAIGASIVVVLTLLTALVNLITQVVQYLSASR